MRRVLDALLVWTVIVLCQILAWTLCVLGVKDPVLTRLEDDLA